MKKELQKEKRDRARILRIIRDTFRARRVAIQELLIKVENIKDVLDKYPHLKEPDMVSREKENWLDVIDASILRPGGCRTDTIGHRIS